MTESKSKVGFIGLGLMGSSFAKNLQKAGHSLVVNDLRREAAADQLVQRQRPAAPGHHRQGQCRPGQMEVGPAVRDGDLDDRGHDQQAEPGEPGRQANHQQRRQHDLGAAGEEGRQRRRRRTDA